MSDNAYPEIPGYRITRKLGSGAMAEVYHAVQTSLDREVALKVMTASLISDQTFRDRFKQEGRIVASLSHPHIMSIYDIGNHGDLYYMAVELVTGGDLEARVGQISGAEAETIMRHIASALDYAHEAGFVHRDVKPANVLFRADGTALLSDFGIAKESEGGTQLTQVGFAVGTPNYMSPEQAMGQKLDGRSDLYSLGVMFYEMLAGERPLGGTDAVSSAMAHLNEAPRKLPRAFARYQPVMDVLLAKDREDRYPDGASIVDALNALPRPSDKESTMVIPVGGLKQKNSGARRPASRPVRRGTGGGTSGGGPGGRPMQHAPSRKPLYIGLAMLLVAGGGAAGWYFLAGPGATPSGPGYAVTPTPAKARFRFCPPSDPVSLSDAQQQRIDRLLEAANAHRYIGNLVEPAGGSALWTYRQILALDPNNPAACAGMKSLADLLVGAAEDAWNRQSRDEVMEAMNAAIQVAPDYPEFITLRKKIEDQWGKLDLATPKG